MAKLNETYTSEQYLKKFPGKTIDEHIAFDEPKQKKKPVKTNTNNLTLNIVNYLNYNGFLPWRNNNGAVYSVKKQTFIKNKYHKLGIFDICGFRKSDAKHLEIEIKTGKDILSDFQIIHLQELKDAGCVAFVAHSIDEFITLINQYLK